MAKKKQLFPAIFFLLSSVPAILTEACFPVSIFVALKIRKQRKKNSKTILLNV